MEIRKGAVNWQLVAALLLIIAGTALRLLPHIPNFAPVGAIALFGGAVLGWRLAVWLPLALMISSDLFIGFYPGIAFTWAGFLLVALFGMLLRRMGLAGRIVIGGAASGVLFFVVSNFGVWLTSGMYAHTFDGLAQCYAMALPFFRVSLIADLFYSAVIFGLYELVLYAVRVRQAVRAAAPLK